VELPFGLNPYESDPGHWGASLLNNAELVLALLDAAKAQSVIEVGAYAGDLTRLLLLWAESSGARIVAIDPSPEPQLERLEREHTELRLIREPSLSALLHTESTDAVILDGDHNYYTVTEELSLLTAGSRRSPLILLHDVCWPHERRDTYFDPEQIPAEHRQSVAPEGRLYPGVPGTQLLGMPYHWPAATEGGPRNGVLTAIEDFLASHDELDHAVIPVFFGLGVVWPKGARYADELRTIVEPWDRNPLLERLERNRVLHLASSQAQFALAVNAQQRLRRAVQLLDRMLHSRAFAAAELFLRVRQLGKPIFSREDIRRVIDQAEDRGATEVRR
jgi:Methyltransferase domain